jgi:hypothetical protein
MAALISTYIACFIKHKLAPGELGAVLVLSRSAEPERRHRRRSAGRQNRCSPVRPSISTFCGNSRKMPKHRHDRSRLARQTSVNISSSMPKPRQEPRRTRPSSVGSRPASYRGESFRRRHRARRRIGPAQGTTGLAGPTNSRFRESSAGFLLPWRRGPRPAS